MAADIGIRLPRTGQEVGQKSALTETGLSDLGFDEQET